MYDRSGGAGAALLVVLLVLSVVPRRVSAQEVPPDMPRRARVLYGIDFDEDFFFIAANAGGTLWNEVKQEFPGTEEIWQETLESVLSNSDTIARTVRASEGADLFEQALAENIPVFIHIQVSGVMETGDVTVRYVFREVFSDSYFESRYEEDVWMEEDLAAFFWLPLRFDLDAFIEERVLRPPLLIQGPAGTVVRGFTKKPVRIPESEYIFVDVPIPGTYKWKTSHWRYMNRTGIFMADRGNLVVTLPRDRFSFRDVLRFFDGNNRAGNPTPPPKAAL
ncbi:MAG: hypothetical protein LBD24_01445 [Spirochaetaceae bacterium]|jgi:hypothetical protein|nr:hypothetical protein [Spirochaetaceae bacterium]